MNREIECPVCEAQFVATASGKSKLACPVCKRTFELDIALVSATPDGDRAENSKQPTLHIPPPKGVPTGQSFKAPPPTPTADTVAAVPAAESPLQNPQPENPPGNKDGVSDEDVSSSATSEASLLEVRQRYRRKNRQRTYLAISVASVFVLIIAGLTVWFIVRVAEVDFSSDTDSIATIDPKDSTSIDIESNTGDQTSRKSTVPADVKPLFEKQRPKPKPIKQLKLAELPPQKLKILNQKSLDRAWAVAQPRLVTLKVFRPTGVQKVLGTLIDSRGWIVTSYRAVAGATKIEVAETPKKIDDLQRTDLLKDEVRGVISSDPKRDLLVLAINRRFVKSFGQLEFGDRSDVVAGQYVVHAAPPSHNNVYATEETQVIQRSDRLKLPQAALDQLESIGMEADDERVLIAVRNTDAMQTGSLLLSNDGKLLGVNLFTAEENSYFLFVDRVGELLAQAPEQPLPLSSMFSEQQKAIIKSQEKQQTIADDSVRVATQTIEVHGEACETFGWIATTPAQFESLQKFAQSMSKIQSFLARNQRDRKQADAIRELKAITRRWEESVSAGINERGNHEPSMVKMAMLSADMLTQTELNGHQQYIPFFGKVFIAGIVSPDPDAMFLKVARSDVYVKTPYQLTKRAMLPDSEWLCFVRRQPTRQTSNHRIKNVSLKADAARLMFAIGPLPASF